MTKTESERMILREWDQWQPNPSAGTYQQMESFYEWLKENRPELLKWKLQPEMTELDRWQDVQAWLNKRTNYGQR